VGSLSVNVSLRGRILSVNVGLKRPMLSSPAVYVIEPLVRHEVA
jgi:hypothetical protein